MEVRKKLLLLQITDSAFPIGAYSHSFGLETYIQKGMVKSREEAWNYIRQSIRYSLTFTELLGVRRSWRPALSRRRGCFLTRRRNLSLPVMAGRGTGIW